MFTDALCGCYYDGTGPVWTENPVTPPYTNSISVSVSATFTEPAVIFESAYENRPGEWVSRRSTRTRLNIVADGGLNGAVLTVSTTNLVKLSHLSGPGLPLASVSVPAETSVSYSIVYEGLAESDAQNDIAVTATVTENMTGTVSSNTCTATSIRLELAAVWEAPENPCTNRHVYGVGEKVKCSHKPDDVYLTWDIHGLMWDNDIQDGSTLECDNIVTFSYFALGTPDLRASFEDVEYVPAIRLIEPQNVECRSAEWDGMHAPQGVAGGFGMLLDIYVLPMSVSFQGIDMIEEPCYEVIPPSGYYASTNFNGVLSHTLDAQAGWWNHVKPGNRWTIDNAAANIRNPPWSEGVMSWKIPVAWYKRFNDEQYSWPRNSFESVRCRIPASESYRQVFTMSETGTMTITKFGHTISRTTNDVIHLDGVLINH